MHISWSKVMCIVSAMNLIVTVSKQTQKSNRFCLRWLYIYHSNEAIEQTTEIPKQNLITDDTKKFLYEISFMTRRLTTNSILFQKSLLTAYPDFAFVNILFIWMTRISCIGIFLLQYCIDECLVFYFIFSLKLNPAAAKLSLSS